MEVIQHKQKKQQQKSVILKLLLNHHLLNTLRCYALGCLLEQQETRGLYYLFILEGLIFHRCKICVCKSLFILPTKITQLAVDIV